MAVPGGRSRSVALLYLCAVRQGTTTAGKRVMAPRLPCSPVLAVRSRDWRNPESGLSHGPVSGTLWRLANLFTAAVLTSYS
jgi:hypothetical protein